MVRYFYAWTPLVVVVGTVVLLTVPYVALIALLAVALVALAGLARALVSVPHLVGLAAGPLGRAIARRRHRRTQARPPVHVSLGGANR